MKVEAFKYKIHIKSSWSLNPSSNPFQVHFQQQNLHKFKSHDARREIKAQSGSKTEMNKKR